MSETIKSIENALAAHGAFATRIAVLIERLAICITQEPFTLSLRRDRAAICNEVRDTVRAFATTQGFSSRDSSPLVSWSSQATPQQHQLRPQLNSLIAQLGAEWKPMRLSNYDKSVLGSLQSDRQRVSRLLAVVEALHQYRVNVESTMTDDHEDSIKLRLMNERDQMVLCELTDIDSVLFAGIERTIKTQLDRIEVWIERMFGAASERSSENKTEFLTTSSSSNVLEIVNGDYLHPRWNGKVIPMINRCRATVLERLVDANGGPLSDEHLRNEAKPSDKKGELRGLFRTGGEPHEAWGTIIAQAQRPDGTAMKGHRRIPAKKILKTWPDRETDRASDR
ncbi:hypothetical protein [Rhodopirellula bahusiensis]|nr:hypothetical protein [Rhodopirellula bahusiensis]